MLLNKAVCIRYSEAFKMQVISELESGKLANVSEARRIYGISGGVTIQGWLKKYGRNDLLAKVVRVEKPNERDQIKHLQKEVRQLKEALADTQMDYLLSRSFYELLCDKVGVDGEEFKKKVNMKQSATPKKSAAKKPKK